MVKEGYELQVGDVIVSKSGFGINRHAVHRVTKKYAFVRLNDVAEGKFPRVYGFAFMPLPRQARNPITYTVMPKEQPK